MQYTYLGNTAMKVSRLCFGTMNFGACSTEREAFRMMDEALEMGISFFDTVDAYGAERGGTEQITGVGSRTLEQLQACGQVPESTLSEEDLKALDIIFPGPGGEAPQATPGNPLPLSPPPRWTS